MKQNILISTGGSGGHVIPALIFYEHLKDYFDVSLSSDLRGSKFIDDKSYNLKIIDVSPVSKNIILLPYKILLFIFAILKSLTFLKKNKLKIVISTGGYMSLPVCIAAKILNCKIILFEPNIVIGRANRFLLKTCYFIFCYSEKIINFPNRYNKKIRLIPPLLRKEIYSQKRINNYKISEKKKILIIGGSQGADFFQNNLKEVILRLSKKFQLEVIHQASNKNHQTLKIFYKQNKIKFDLFSFKNNLYKSILESDVCITRSGASSLAELVHLNLPFVAIPFPYAKDKHQLYNALFYKNLNCCWLLEQDLNISDNLYNLISNIFVNKDETYKKIDAMKKISYENTWNNINKKIIGLLDEN